MSEMDLVLPRVGDVWHWEPLKPWASKEIAVTEVTWNGEEHWVACRTESGQTHWNELFRFVEAAVFVRPGGQDADTQGERNG